MIPLLILALLTLAASLLLAVQLVVGLRSLPRVADAAGPVAADASAEAPSVSIVVAARDEAADIAPAMLSLLAQDHPDLEVVAVDDRSTDGTGSILDRLTAQHERLRVLHLTELPAGWLGKNHALQRGAERATGDRILFTDADVMMRPDAVRRASALMTALEVDHLAVAPRISAGGPWATMALSTFLVVFFTFFRPWKARDPNSRHHIGIGAFNLVRADAYRAIGGHRSLALRPDDDVRLGRALKVAGYRQAAASGPELVSVEWYPSLPAMARGLRKNAFAVMDYRLSLVAAGTLLPVLSIFWPLAALALTSGTVWWLNAAIVAVGAATTGITARAQDIPLWTAPTYPVGSLLLLWIVWAAALRVVVTGSVEWRGTKYSLAELRDR